MPPKRASEKMKGKFPHFVVEILTARTAPKTPTGRAKKCAACKQDVCAGEFVISETKPLILAYNGRMDESGGPTHYTQWYHGVQCFGFFADTVRDDKLRVKNLLKKLGLAPTDPEAQKTPAFIAAYDSELLFKRFEGFAALPVTQKEIVREIMKKGTYADPDGGATAAAAESEEEEDEDEDEKPKAKGKGKAKPASKAASVKKPAAKRKSKAAASEDEEEEEEAPKKKAKASASSKKKVAASKKK